MTVNAISVSNNTKIFKINLEKFQKIIIDKQIIDIFKERALVKDKWRNQ